MPDNDIVTDPTTGGGTQPTSTPVTTPIAPVVIPAKKQPTAQEYLQQQIDNAKNKASQPITNTPAPQPATNTTVAPKLNQQQVDAKYKGNPYLAGGRDQWGGVFRCRLTFLW